MTSAAPGPRDPATVVDDFHRLWYDTGIRQEFGWTTWLGHRVLKFPCDLFVYQEILVETRPELVVETGTFNGGSALFLATVMEALGRGRVVTIDVDEHPDRPAHPRIDYVHGSSVDPAILADVRARATDAAGVMVLLDSDHTKDHVARELDAYAPIVTEGCYLVVEDTNVNGHPVWDDFGPGPMEAVRDFVARHPEFEVDEGREKLLMTFNPSGYLRRRPS